MEESGGTRLLDGDMDMHLAREMQQMEIMMAQQADQQVCANSHRTRIGFKSWIPQCCFPWITAR